MDERSCSSSILVVSTFDIAGGAEKVAWDLYNIYQRDNQSWLFVGYKKRSNDSNVILIPNHKDGTLWSKPWAFLQLKVQYFFGHIRGVGLLSHWLDLIAHPEKIIDKISGREDFNFSGTRYLLNLTSLPPDIVHCHNLHGRYFDLRELQRISKRVPVVLTLHDAWLLSGHCAHSFACERWKTGCGNCPDLTIPPAICQDATAYNWRRKKKIFAQSRMYVATPSKWLMQKVEQSILAPAVVEARVIPNGVNLFVFHPADKVGIRKSLGIPQDAMVILFAANGIRKNIWKDYKTMRNVISLLAKRLKTKCLLFIALGEDAPAERISKAEVLFIPYKRDPEAVARYYQASDIYMHAARADTFPNTVIEALACGIPVVATAVGGIPEQVEDGISGFLTPPGDAEAMARRIQQLIENDELRRRMGVLASESARKRFDLERQADAYLEWFREIIN